MLDGKLIGAGLLLLAALGLAWHGQPSAAQRVAHQAARLEAQLATGELRIDPAELADLMQNRQIRLKLLDLRSEADYNLFHLTHAVRIEPAQLDADWVAQLPPATIVVVMSNDEQAAETGWKLLAAQGVLNAYILGGGINLWLDVYRDGQLSAALPARGSGDDHLRHTFATARGADYPWSRPDPQRPVARAFTAKVKAAVAAKKPKGGCG